MTEAKIQELGAAETARPKLLDLFCGGGGAAMGYHLAGFDVIGIDHKPQPKYPFPFILADALKPPFNLTEFDAIHASPPCQRHSRFKYLAHTEHQDLIEPTRALLQASGKPYILENVPGAPLINPIRINGPLVNLLNIDRERWFECNFSITQPNLPPRRKAPVKTGRPVLEGDVITVAGHFSDVPYARRAMDINWLGQKELAQAIPPAYTELIGRHLIGLLK